MSVCNNGTELDEILKAGGSQHATAFDVAVGFEDESASSVSEVPSYRAALVRI